MAPGQAIKDGFQLLIGLAEIHVPRMWVEVDNEGKQTEVGVYCITEVFLSLLMIIVYCCLQIFNNTKGFQ